MVSLHGGQTNIEVASDSESTLLQSSHSKVSNSNGLQIFCRLRPVVQDNNCVEREKQTGQIQKRSDTILSLKRFQSYIEQQYIFERIIDQQDDQNEVFEQIAVPLLENLFQGKDALLFAYGVTSSGKSYTINGTSEYPGIIPRSIHYIFNVLGSEHLNTDHKILPDFQNFYIVNNEVCGKESNDTLFEQSLYQSAINRKKYQNSVLKWAQGVHSIENRYSVNLADIANKRYSVFVSFVEIYNNYIYDLLEKQDKQCIEWKRSPHQLRQDCNQMVYVQGANEIEVVNSDQAIKLFLYGLQNRRMAQTMLNASSSRSHSVFTVKLVFYHNQDLKGLDHSKLKVNQFSIVDLAGMERTTRTKNTGSKLTEASNINNSLMTLRNCFEVMRKNQTLKKALPVPYRENKLTFLFKSFFESGSKIRMIICLKADADNFDENIQVLSFAQKAQEIVIEDLNNDGDQTGDNRRDSSTFDVLELNLARFRCNESNTSSVLDGTLIEELEHFLPVYKSDMEKIFDSTKKIINRLDISLKPYPEKQLDRTSIILNRYKLYFSKLNKKLHLLYNNEHCQRLSLDINNIANTPIITFQYKEIEQKSTNVKNLLIQEFNRDLQLWEMDSLDISTKLKSIVNDCFRYVNSVFNCQVFSLQMPISQMDVFNRLYHQTPARLKANQKTVVYSSSANKHSTQRVTLLKKLFTPRILSSQSVKHRTQCGKVHKKSIKISHKIETLCKKLSKVDPTFVSQGVASTSAPTCPSINREQRAPKDNIHQRDHNCAASPTSRYFLAKRKLFQ